MISGRPSSSSGVALLLVLWMLVLSTIMAGSFALTMQRELSIAGNFRDMAQTSALAEAGINYAMLMLLQADEEQQWLSDGTIYEIEFEGARIRITITDESGKISVNNPEPELLRGALSEAGADETLQDKIIEGIQDWQDSDEQARLHGAEVDDYSAAGLSYGPSNENFQAIEELQMVLGMNADVYNRLVPIVTVHSNSNKVNPAKSPKEVLMALPDMDEQTAENYITERTESAKNSQPAPEFPGISGTSNSSSGVYTLVAEAMLDNGNTGKTKAVIKKVPSEKGLPFTVLEWHSAPVNEGSLF